MARIVEERWMGIGWDVVTEQLPAADENGNPVFDGLGQPKLIEHTTLVFVHRLPDGQRVVRIPFRADKKGELVAKLTGGIVVAPAGAVMNGG